MSSSEDFLTQAEQSALHRHTYTSVLKGMLAHGEAKHFATERLGVTAVYMSNLLDPDHPPPSPLLAERIVNALPLDADQRQGLLEHMILARESKKRSATGLRAANPASPQEMRLLHAELRRAYDASILTSASAQHPIVGVRDAGKGLLSRLRPRLMPLVFIETCLIVHAAQMALNRWEDALNLTLLAEAALQQVDEGALGAERGWLHHLRVNIPYAQAVTYRNLNLPRRADFSLSQSLSALRSAPPIERAFWLPSIYKERIGVLWNLPRFALAEVEGIADSARTFLESRAEPGDAAMRLLIDRGLIDACTRYGSRRSLKRASQLIYARMDQLASIPGVGPMQQTMFLRSALRAFWKQGRRDEWRHYASELVQLAEQSGLRHQISEVRREYGSAFDELTGALGPHST
ncbi:MAG: hypothetical protein L6Q98_15080 [Anaerolineae bacterium]|nr:hypothetical protein [Anaerolineae bacterium]